MAGLNITARRSRKLLGLDGMSGEILKDVRAVIQHHFMVIYKNVDPGIISRMSEKFELVQCLVAWR